MNADAQIGTVTVGGDWIASNLVAGVQDDANPARNAFFGDGNDQKITGGTDTAARISKIASITIKGAVLGTGSILTDHFGFLATNIGIFKAGGVTVATPTPFTDLSILTGSDVTIHKVA